MAVTVVSRSDTSALIETFMTVVSTVMRNWVVASNANTAPLPRADSTPGAGPGVVSMGALCPSDAEQLRLGGRELVVTEQTPCLEVGEPFELGDCRIRRRFSRG